MFENHKEFIDWAKTYDTADIDSRSAKLHMEWLKRIKCPFIKLDGRLSSQNHLGLLQKYL